MLRFAVGWAEIPLAPWGVSATLRAMTFIPIFLFGSIAIITVVFCAACLAESKGKY